MIRIFKHCHVQGIYWFICWKGCLPSFFHGFTKRQTFPNLCKIYEQWQIIHTRNDITLNVFSNLCGVVDTKGWCILHKILSKTFLNVFWWKLLVLSFVLSVFILLIRFALYTPCSNHVTTDTSMYILVWSCNAVVLKLFGSWATFVFQKPFAGRKN